VFGETLQKWHMTTAGLPCDDQARTTSRRAASRKQMYSSKTTKYGLKSAAWLGTGHSAMQDKFTLRILEVLQVGSMLDSE